MKKTIKKFVAFLRKLIGVSAINNRIDNLQWQNNELRKELKNHYHLANKLISYIEFSNLKEKEIKQSRKFQIFHKFRSLLSPMDIEDSNYRRVGKDFDGGYMMLDDFSCHNVTAA